jgi:phage terminase Nu1 subunit (DNA packaging protein)
MAESIHDGTGILDGLDKRAQLAHALGVTQRTVIRYEQQGLPVIRRGRMRLYDRAKAAAWLRGEMPQPEVRRGRPRTR